MSLIGGVAWFGGLGAIGLIGACAEHGAGVLIPGMVLVLPALCVVGLGSGIVGVVVMSLLQERRLRRLDFRGWGPCQSFQAAPDDDASWPSAK